MKCQMRIPSFLIFLFLPVLLTVGCTPPENDSATITGLMQRYHDIGQFNGAVLVSHNGQVILEKAYGEANREWSIKNTVDTKFRLGSATKQFTAALVLDLVEEKKLALDDLISDYLPEFRSDIGEIVTIHHLLTHSSGITMPKMTSEEYWDFFQKRKTTRELVDTLCSKNLAFTPGEKFTYSSAGYILLGAIIERVTGKPYEQVLRERILEAYDMSGTGIDDPEAIIEKRASGYQTNYGFGNARYKYMPSSFSSGAVYSTVGDLYKWDQALHTTSFLGKELKALMFSPQMECPPEGYGSGWFGCGWFIKQVPGAGDSTQTRVFHGGDVSGFCALIIRVLDTRDCVVLLSNQEGLHYNEIASNILDVLNGRKPDLPLEYVADLLRESIFVSGLESALQGYSEMKSRGIDDYDTDESEITELGYDLLKIDRINAAIEVFKINVELNQESADVYDSLGEGYFVAQQYEAALFNYQKALEVDPEYSHPAKMLLQVEEAIKNK
jgi:CubicO group peptidase (beta-lactamase class C family)